MRRSYRLTVCREPRVAAALLILGACSADRPVHGPTVRDSLGVRIVENLAAAPPLAWRIPADPRVDIGGSRDDDQTLFQVVSASRLSDGRIVVANGGTRELRYYGARGEFVQAAGGTGEGPGEFRQLLWMGRLAGDSLIAFDLGLIRLSVFDSAGVFARSFRLAAADSVPFAHVIGMYADGSFLAQGFATTGDATPRGLQRYEAPLYHFGRDGALLAELGQFSGNDGYYVPFGDGGFSFYEAFFPRYTYRVAAAGHLYVAANDAYELRRYTPGGSLRGIARRAVSPVSVGPGDVRRERERRLAATAAGRRDALAAVLDRMPKPETFPAYGLVRGADDGSIWVQAYPIRPEPRVPWAVFDSSGVLLGEVELPTGFDPKHIGSDFVLGVWRDELDVEHVHLYQIVKP